MAAARNSKPGDLFVALAHPLRRRILRKMIEDDGDISPRELSLALEEPLSKLSYHVRILAWCGAIELVRTEQVRGSMQHFYDVIIDARWARMALKAPERAKP
jgi:DNA-binding transcriptional ArsR family regulator